MYQGENLKVTIEIRDSAENIIPKANVNSIDVLIYDEANRKVHLKFSTGSKVGYGLISPVDGEEKYEFTITSDQTENLPHGRYMISIKTNTDSSDFSEGLVDIEQAPLFEIVKTIKDA